MFTYKNKVTGVTVTTFGKVSGGDWVEVKAADPEKETGKKAKNSKDDAQ